MNTNLFMVRGDTFRFNLEIEGLEEDLTNAYFSCKKNKDDTEYLFQKSLGDGITKKEDTDTSKIYEVVVAPEDTEDAELFLSNKDKARIDASLKRQQINKKPTNSK